MSARASPGVQLGWLRWWVGEACVGSYVASLESAEQSAGADLKLTTESSAHSAGVHGHAAQVSASRTDRVKSEPPAGLLWDVDTGDRFSPAFGRTVTTPSHVGQM